MKQYKSIAFCRVSTTQQDYTRQIADLMPLIKSDGFKDDEIYIIKHKESATKNDINNRMSIAELRKIIENNPIEAVYCTEASRLARRGDVLYGVLSLLEEHHISLVIQTPTVIRTYENGKPNPIAHVVIAFLGQVAQQEMELKVERQKSGYAQKVKDGKVCSSRVKFGYARNKSGYAEINEEQAKVVNDIFGLYIDGMSVTAIWDRYKYTGIFSQKIGNNKSGWNLITNMLRDTTYIGKNKSFQYPPIIDAKLFGEVQKKMDSNQMIKSKLKYVYYCQGLLKCNAHTMTPAVSEVTYSYRDTNTGKTVGINMNAMDSLLWGLSVTAKAQMDSVANENRQKNIKRQLESITMELAGIANEKDKIGQQIKRATDIYIRGTISEDEYIFRMGDFEAQLSQLDKEEKALAQSKIELLAVLEKADKKHLQGSKDFYALAQITDDNLRKEIIQECIEYADVKVIEKGVFHVMVQYRDKSLNDSTYYRYEQRGCKKHLYCCYGDFFEDWTDSIVQRIKRYERKK